MLIYILTNKRLMYLSFFAATRHPPPPSLLEPTQFFAATRRRYAAAPTALSDAVGRLDCRTVKLSDCRTPDNHEE